ncbi:MAG TPA: hypothetical protein PLF22_03025 [Pseudomonadales bacterium]|nr:hypothetical protein [Pseudomonadales bacterium]
MRNMLKLDPGSIIIMLITLALFIAAVFTTGFTHDLLLEAGVFLVSVKLIIMNYKQQVSSDAIQQQLDDIKSLLRPEIK